VNVVDGTLYHGALSSSNFRGGNRIGVYGMEALRVRRLFDMRIVGMQRAQWALGGQSVIGRGLGGLWSLNTGDWIH
jgi:hypothetical protein